MQEPRKLGRKVVVKTQRKGKFGKGTERNGKTGKIGLIYTMDPHGSEIEKHRFTAPNFKALQKKLRGTGLIPTYVTLNHNGETCF